MTSYKPRIFTPLDVGTAILVPLLFAGLMLGATLTPGNEGYMLAIGWAIAALTWVFVGLHFHYKRKRLAIFKWVTRQGVVLGARDCEPDWTGVEDVIDDAISKLKPKYEDADLLIHGVVAVFVPEPFKHLQYEKVAGIQDGQAVLVSLAPTMAQTALAHELGHVVLQYAGGDPVEDEAHKILATLGL